MYLSPEKSKIMHRMLDLYHPNPKTPEERAFIKSNLKKSDKRIIYFIWNQKRHNEKYYGILIDTDCKSDRKSAVWKAIKIIAERDLCDIEFEEIVDDYGCNNRRYEAFNYSTIDELVEGDSRYGITTDKEIVKAMKR